MFKVNYTYQVDKDNGHGVFENLVDEYSLKDFIKEEYLLFQDSFLDEDEVLEESIIATGVGALVAIKLAMLAATGAAFFKNMAKINSTHNILLAKNSHPISHYLQYMNEIGKFNVEDNINNKAKFSLNGENNKKFSFVLEYNVITHNYKLTCENNNFFVERKFNFEQKDNDKQIISQFIKDIDSAISFSNKD